MKATKKTYCVIEELEQQLCELRALLNAERQAAMKRIEELERLNAELIKQRDGALQIAGDRGGWSVF